MAAPRAGTTREPRRGRGTSLSGGKVQTSHRLHGAKSHTTDADDPNSRRGRSKSREHRKPKARREYNTPFDDKGRCHYHTNVQLASKKFNGGWKVLCNACPKCMEQKQDSGDEKSVRSGRSARSGKSSSGGGDAHGKFDKNGCCALHPHIQVAKKGFLGSGWKVMRTCPSCNGGTSIGLDDDAISVKSGKSSRSNSSRKSKTNPKKLSNTSKSGKATQSGRYGALPFDGDGYCCRHPSVQIAQKKIIGGFKIIHDVCPDCAADDGVLTTSSRKGRSRSKSRSRHRSSSRHSRHQNRVDDESGSVTSSKKKKRIRVKNLKTEDEHGKHGRYSGYVNDDHQPHGDGVMRYDDGNEWDGVWSEGSQVHGKIRKGKKKEQKSRF
mmetsp:Transcript_16023/g.34659  ORF Transcript_16023/g.34659 Transcript_16023/m.34659 type:complete len:380 (-) Transcript_16023:112-1251(-)|eukprot:CAMPEP_0172303036 /NCGR_PEP_ID=MMETSP1058-20130122/4633_1 /TAXON_ID=83371 /ORGANISM="Detonula confervacea, Strain CCMP 353" /LENGTH=379 /DNA_ID=CAMNT_0013013715 /DNA_START=142 /DNA_END=1281 /DNA_ORIENTATION=-